MQLDLFHPPEALLTKVDLFGAYFDARRNKRSSRSALEFELNFETELYRLLNEINSGHYTPGRCNCFVVDRPVKREILAAEFRDRIVHHLIINKLNNLFEKRFIYDSYACRLGKGTHFGIERLQRFMRRCTENYTQEGYVLKLDIQGFFMSINRELLYKKVSSLVNRYYTDGDKTLVLQLCHVVIFNDPIKSCIRKSPNSAWQGLPPNKSLFHSAAGHGLPIGNLTSQVFANVFLNEFDHFVKRDLGFSFYGRYVDDFFLVHRDRDKLKANIPVIAAYLSEQLGLILHPRKIYLQPCSRGVKFLGAVIKPGRTYIANRTRGSFYDRMNHFNQLIRQAKPTPELINEFMCSMNSYLGIMKPYRSYRLRKKMITEYLSAYWLNHFTISKGYTKVVKKQRLLRSAKAYSLSYGLYQPKPKENSQGQLMSTTHKQPLKSFKQKTDFA